MSDEITGTENVSAGQSDPAMDAAMTPETAAAGDGFQSAQPEQPPHPGGDFISDAISKQSPDIHQNIQEAHIEVIMDVPITLSLEIGRTRITIRDLLQLNPGSVVKLERMAGEPMDIMVNGCLVAKGEVVTVGEKFGVRIAEVVSPEERIKSLK